MRTLRAILFFVFATEVAFSFSFDHRNSVVRTKRQVNCRNLGHSIWSSWGPCYPVEYGMERRRYRLPRGYSFQSNVCPKIWEYQECTERDIATADDDSFKCKFSEWSDWDDCEYTSTSALYKQRHRIVKLSKEDGFKCSEVKLADFTESEECINDCSWTPWTSCFKYLTPRGEIFDRYRIKESKLHKNLNCRHKADFQGCQFCEWAAWTNWGPCIKDVENSQRRRWRARQFSNSNDGKLCSLLLDKDVLDTEKCTPEEETTPNPNPYDGEITQAAMPVAKS